VRQLIWKEWHEQSWRLGFGCIVLCALVLIGLHARLVSDETLCMWVCSIGVTLLPLLAAMGLAPAAREEGTLQTMLSLPIRPWKILVAKTAMGLLLCAVPLVLSGMVGITVAGEREMTFRSMLALFGQSALCASAMFIWMQALTAKLPTETRAALICVGLVVILLLLMGGVYSGEESDARQLFRIVYLAITPFGFLMDGGSGPGVVGPLLRLLIVQLFVLAGLWFLTARWIAQPVEDGE
jgi:hypothetical protein